MMGFTSRSRECRRSATTRLRIFIDPDLLQYDEVWAAAGTWTDVFPLRPDLLAEASAATIVDLQKN